MIWKLYYHFEKITSSFIASASNAVYDVMVMYESSNIKMQFNTNIDILIIDIKSPRILSNRIEWSLNMYLKRKVSSQQILGILPL